MSGGRKIDRRKPEWLAPVTSTVTRCHLFGSIIAISLIICVAWVWSLSLKKVSTIQIGDKTIDLREAAALVENADEWRQLYTINFRNSEAVGNRARMVADWLPTVIDWPETEKEIRSASLANALAILSIEQGKTHVGTRVGVVVATCEVRGTYASLCRFLNELSARPQPIACSEIELHRIGDSHDSMLGPHTQNCRAKLWLRIPFAASSTAAGQILTEDKNQTPYLLKQGAGNAS